MAKRTRTRTLIPAEIAENRILLIRGQKVMLDSDLADLYQVETKQLIRQVKRNIERFPDDFMFRLTKNEANILRCQFGTSRWGGRRYLPMVFTEFGVSMLSSVLKSDRAIHVNIQIMRAFAKLRGMLMAHRDLRKKIEDMEKKYDSQFRIVFDAIKQILTENEKPKRKIGFLRD